MLKRASELQDKLIAHRHDFHQNPEVGFTEPIGLGGGSNMSG